MPEPVCGVNVNRRRINSAVALFLIVILPSAARAQARQTTGEIDLRIGTAWLGQGHGTKLNIGAHFALYPWQDAVIRRLGIHVGGDWVEISRAEGSLAGLPGKTQTTLQWYSVGPFVGFDVVRARRIVLDARVGGEFDVTSTTFGLEGDDSDTICAPTCISSPGDGFVDACNLVAFRDQCHSRTRFAGVVALGVRGWPQSAKPWFVGVDYAASSAGRRRFVATIGFAPRRE